LYLLSQQTKKSRLSIGFAFALCGLISHGVPAFAAGTGTGLKGSYFSNTKLTGAPVLVRTDSMVNFQWGTNPPVSSISANQYSVRWTGQIEAPVSGAYTFYTRSDDGVRLWVNNQLLINHWNDHSAWFDQAVPLTLVGGQRYNIQLEYYENQGNAIVQLLWSYPGQVESFVPKIRLYPGDVTLQPAPPVVSKVWLSDLNFLVATNGLGPVQRDRSNGGSTSSDSAQLSMGGQKYNYGLGVAAPSEVKVAIDDQYDMFRTVIGVDDEVGSQGSVVFEVWLDGRRAYQSPVMRGNMPGLAIAVPVENAREISLKVTSNGDNAANDHADWAEARFEGVERVKYLSDLNWTSATNGSGPVEKDRANGGPTSGDGSRIKLRGWVYPKGLGTRAVSQVHYKLNSEYELFSSIIGIDDTAAGPGSATFEVWTGSTKVYTSPVMHKGDAVRHVVVPVKNVNDLILKVLDGGDGTTSDLGDWADAKLLPMGSDMEIPSAPNGLDATAGTGRVTLTWNASPNATSYNIYRGTTAGGESATPRATGVTARTWVDTSVTNGTKYFYKVKAVNVAGVSGYSNEDSATPTGSVVVPTAPGNLDATAGLLSVKLTWNAAPNASTYQVFRGTSAGGQASTPVASGVNGTSYTDNGLVAGTKYFYKVKAVNSAGASGFSNEDSAIPTGAQTIPGPTTNLTATPGNASVALAWTAASGAASYNLYRGTAPNALAASPVATGITGTSYSNTGLTNGTAYYYKVAGVNGAGAGPMSNEATATPRAPLAAPVNLTANPGDAQITLTWSAVNGATAYNVYRGTASGGQASTPVASNVTATSFTNTGLTNGTKYYFKVAAVNGSITSPMSNEASGTPAAVLTAPAGLSATAGNGRITLAWTSVAGAVSYNVYRGTTANGQASTPVATNVNGTSYTNTGLTNGVTYFYKVAGVNTANAAGPQSNEASATPIAPPETPTGLSAVGSDRQVVLTWTAVATATTYNVYAGTTSNGQSATPLATGLTTPGFTHSGIANGTEYFYKVTALNAGGESGRSNQASAAGIGAPPTVDPVTLASFRLLRQATWGPKPGDVARVNQIGHAAFLQEQFNAAPSVYPDTLYDMSVEYAQEHFMRLAITGDDQLRQRVAWALHKIWVVSAVEVDDSRAIVNYHRILLNGAFGNYRNIMRNITLNPAMGRYLNMLNNRSQAITGAPPNENYARELMQLFTLGLVLLNQDGTPMLDAQNRPIPTYTEAEVKALARVFTGWTFGDGNPGTIPTGRGSENYTVPMEAVERYHDADAKTVLGANFPAGQTTVQDLDQALDLIFNHPNIAPFVSRQLIQQLVTSNPSPAYISAIASVFADNGAGVRGDLAAVVRAILEHPEAGLGTNTAGKLMEPALFVIAQVRALNAQVTDHPFMSDLAQEMGQRVFYPGSVFSYFSPGYRVRGTALGGPEFQILTTVTALSRANYTGRLISGGFGGDVTWDIAPFTSLAGDPAALVDYCGLLLMGGQMSTELRNEIISAVRVSPASNPTERVRTALYLTLASAQYQVDR
jgi:uncharacterized protein (DUF1800 family)/fibronectin type 3 domain-containing protein